MTTVPDKQQEKQETAVVDYAQVAINVDDDNDDDANDSPHIHHDYENPLATLATHQSERDVDFDRDILHRCVRDAGRWAYGTVLVEVWAWNDKGTHLVRPLGGWWLDPVFHEHQHELLRKENEELDRSQCPICRLTDRSLENFEPPRPLALGEGLPGVLWAELDRRLVERNTTKATSQRSLVWRQVQGIANDPDQPYNPRLQIIANGNLSATLGWAAAVPFNIHGSQGMVLYLARKGCSLQRLKDDTNENYLISAATLIGATYALRKPRQATVDERRTELENTMARVRSQIRRIGHESLVTKGKKESTSSDHKQSLLSPLEMEGKDDQKVDSPSTNACSTYISQISSHFVRVWHKLRGGGVQPPPPFSWKQTAWTFVSVLVTILMITRTNVWIVQEFGSEAGIVLGPFGAYMTLLYGLTAAPASQPRNALVGQALSMSISIGISQLPITEAWVKQSLATAVCVTCMVKLGITHPPAGAAALLFATGAHGWYSVLTCLIGNCIAIGAATLINNTNPERHYPTYWRLLPSVITDLLSRKKVDVVDGKEDPKKK